MSSANERQVGGTHYKNGGEEHWDRVHRLGLDYFQAQITKYVERCWKKNGVQDLEKARHFLDKYIELKQEVLVTSPSDLNVVGDVNEYEVCAERHDKELVHFTSNWTGRESPKLACGTFVVDDTVFTTASDTVTCPKCKELTK